MPRGGSCLFPWIVSECPGMGPSGPYEQRIVGLGPHVFFLLRPATRRSWDRLWTSSQLPLPKWTWPASLSRGEA